MDSWKTVLVPRWTRETPMLLDDVEFENALKRARHIGEDVDVLRRPDIDLKRLIKKKVFLRSNTVIFI